MFPLVFKFFAGVTPVGVTMMTDINHYLEFVLGLFFAFGFTFEIPIATFLIVSTGLTTTKSLTDKRPYVIVGCFVVGMVLTPGPDVISQVMLAVPMWILFELGRVLRAHGRAQRAIDRSRGSRRSEGLSPSLLS